MDGTALSETGKAAGRRNLKNIPRLQDWFLMFYLGPSGTTGTSGLKFCQVMGISTDTYIRRNILQLQARTLFPIDRFRQYHRAHLVVHIGGVLPGQIHWAYDFWKGTWNSLAHFTGPILKAKTVKFQHT